MCASAPRSSASAADAAPTWHQAFRALPIGKSRRRLPVAAKIALQTAGATSDVDGSPMPPGASALSSRRTSMTGASFNPAYYCAAGGQAH